MSVPRIQKPTSVLDVSIQSYTNHVVLATRQQRQMSSDTGFVPLDFHVQNPYYELRLLSFVDAAH